MKQVVGKLKKIFGKTFFSGCVKVDLFFRNHWRIFMFCLGVFIIAVNLADLSFAQIDEGDSNTAIDDTQIRCAVVTLLALVEGNFGAMIMVVAGIAAVISSAFGQYRAMVGLFVVAAGAFTLRNFVEIFFDVHWLSSEDFVEQCPGVKNTELIET